MQREIKFRGQTLNGNFVHGTYAYDGYNHKIVKILDDGKPAIYQVDPKTIGQYTGLKDKNSKEIYEGDIIKWRVFIFAVVWNEEYGCFGPSLKNGHDVLGKYLYSDKAEIIGNIHENPELLEKL